MQDNFFETTGTPKESTFPAEQNRQNILSSILSLPLTPNQKRIAESIVNYALGEFPDNLRATYLLAKQKCYGLNKEEFQELEPNCFFPEEAPNLQRFIRERIVIEINGSKIEIVNRITDREIALDPARIEIIKKTLKRVVEKVPPLIPKLLKIFIVSKDDVEQQEYAPNREITKRQCDKNPTGMVLTQRGYRIDISHRIPGITNLEGTIVHELGYFIQKYFLGFEAHWYEALNY